MCSLVVSDLRSETKGFRLQAMCRGELSAVIARLEISKRVEVIETS